uniref:Uncharacterized protein n=1 Tax=Anguilla anguilla TaxID=7936 RepID=A0A0E9RW37_ANGAN
MYYFTWSCFFWHDLYPWDLIYKMVLQLNSVLNSGFPIRHGYGSISS